MDHGVKIASVLYITPLMRHSLGDDRYGSWLLAMSVVGYLILLDAGVTFASVRFFAHAVGEGDKRHQCAIEREARRILRFIGLGILVCTLVAIPIMPWIASQKFSVLQVTAPLVFCGLVTAVRFAFRMPVILLRAHVRYDLLAWASIVRTLAQTFSMSWVLINGYGLIGAAIAHGGGELLELLLQTRWARRLPKTQAFDLPQDEKRKARRELFAYSNSVLLVNIGDSLRLQVNPLLISRMFGVAEVPVYSIGLRLITMLEDIVNALFGGQVLSVFSQLHGAGKHEELRTQFRRVTRITSIFGAWAVVGAVFVSEPFLKRWMGADFGRAHDVLFILAFPYALRFMQFPSHSLIYSAGAPRWLIWVNFAGGFVTVILSLLLGPIFGQKGLVMGTALEMSAVYLLIMPFMVGKLARIHPVRHLLEDVLWPGIKALAIPVLYGWAFSSWLTPDFTRLFMFGAGYMLVFAVSAPFMALDKQTCGIIWRLLPKSFRL